MKKLTSMRVRAMLCLFIRQLSGRFSSLLSERHSRVSPVNRQLEIKLDAFFKAYPPEKVRYIGLLNFQCWALQEGSVKGRISDQEFAGFLDELNTLIAALYRYHSLTRDEALLRAGIPLQNPVRSS